MTTRQLRVLRGAVAAVVATLLAATSHTIAGGPAPAPLLVALMIALLTPVAGGLIGPRPHLPRLATAVIVSQAAFHAAFQLLGSPAGARIAEHHGHGATPLPLLAAAPESAGMYTGHAVAALLTVVLLWRGERIVRAIARGSLAVLRRIDAPRTPLSAAMPAPQVLVARPVVARLLSPVSRRGPPAPLGV
ncbi:hypothetical protein [Microbacterium rhizophilus]|uniref:hypothetical protein n=1 Tax=Microbacterium rhizophilus TaxID=3138934 RepID=UPI0031EA51A5